MLLQTAGLLLALGLVTWIIGRIFSYTGIATIGAAIVLIVGGAVILGGLEVKTGMTETTSYTTINNSTVANETVVQYQYEQTAIGDIFGIGILGELGLGGLLMLLGAILMSQVLAEDL